MGFLIRSDGIFSRSDGISCFDLTEKKLIFFLSDRNTI